MMWVVAFLILAGQEVFSFENDLVEFSGGVCGIEAFFALEFFESCVEVGVASVGDM